jgi:hypothetical protein
MADESQDLNDLVDKLQQPEADTAAIVKDIIRTKSDLRKELDDLVDRLQRRGADKDELVRNILRIKKSLGDSVPAIKPPKPAK